jgi:hypothetical protein
VSFGLRPTIYAQVGLFGITKLLPTFAISRSTPGNCASTR